jgi:glucokinase
MEYTIAIDLGGTIIKAGLFENNRLIDAKQLQANRLSGFQANLPHIEETIQGLLSHHDVRPDQLSGIGLAFPGLVDPYKCQVISTNEKYDDAYGFDIKKWVKDRWNVFFCMDNDARLAVAGEWYCGAGAGRNNVVMMTIGTGIGTGVIIDGNILYGKHFQAGSLGGHFVVDYRGRKCSCGNIGCVEALASSFFLPDIIRQHTHLSASFREKAEKTSFKALFQWAADGDREAVLLVNECMDIWSAAIITYIHAYDPEIVILGGGVMNSRAVIIPYIQEKVDTYAWCPTEKVKVVSSELSENAALMGLDYCMTPKQRLRYVSHHT